MAASLNKQRIAKNTIMLYIRMLFIMVVGLYTSRVVLSTLGASDYGIYNVVGGFVAMLAYVNSTFVDATQRFISFSLGKGDIEELKKVFATSKATHYCLAFLILVVAETFGIWFINNHLNIDSNRLYAAHWVFQCSLISLIVTIISIPYNACIVAHEHMHVYAYVSIAEAILKLVVVYLLVISPFDHLITYAVLLVVVSLIVRLCYTIYCSRKFEECSVGFKFDNKKFKEMSSFAAWVLVGNLGFTFKDQFSNILLNVFLGTTVNAARGVSMQVNGIVNTFSRNFFMAISPQITKQYASNDINKSKQLVYIASKFSFLLMGFLTVPVIINANYLLNIWLVEVPQYTYEFICIVIIASQITSLSYSVTTAIQATGNIRAFQIGISFIMLLELPVAYVFLKLGYPAPYALLPAIVTSLIGIFYRFFILNRQVPEYEHKVFFGNIVFRSILAYTFTLCICFIISNIIELNFATFLLSSIVYEIIYIAIILLCGLNNKERLLLIEKVKQLKHKKND